MLTANSLARPASSFTKTQSAKTASAAIEVLDNSASWWSLPEKDIKHGKGLLAYQSWLLNETDRLFIASLDRAGKWTHASEDDKIKGIAILRKPETERTEEDNIFIAHLDKNETVTY